jgi:hypothetical protein
MYGNSPRNQSQGKPGIPVEKGRILTLPPGKAAPGYSFLNLQGYDGKPAGLPYQSGAVSGCARGKGRPLPVK